MVKRIYASGDCKVDISQYKDIVDGYSIVKAKFFTTAINVAVIKDNIEDYTVNLEWDELRPLGKGMLQFVLFYANSDSAFNDGSYDQTDVKTTDFYIVSDITVEDNTATDVDVVLAEQVQENINEVNAKVANVYTKDETYSKDEVNDLIEEGGGFIPQNYYDKEDIDGIVDGIDTDISQLGGSIANKVDVSSIDETRIEDVSKVDSYADANGKVVARIGDITNIGKGIQSVDYYDASGNSIVSSITSIDERVSELEEGGLSGDYLPLDSNSEPTVSDDSDTETWCDSIGYIGMQLKDGVLAAKGFKGKLIDGQLDNEVIMPRYIYCMNGVQRNFWHQAILKRWNPYDYYLQFDGNANYQRRTPLVATVKEGNSDGKTVTMKLIDNRRMEIIQSLTSTLKVSTPSAENDGLPKIKVSFIGSSTTQSAYFKEAFTRYVSNFELIGIRHKPNEPTIKHEGRGGTTLAIHFGQGKGVSEDPLYHFMPFWQPNDVSANETYRYWGATGFWILAHTHPDNESQNVNENGAYNNGCYNPEVLAKFDSTTGFLVNPTQGDIMYNNNTSGYTVYDGTQWVSTTRETYDWSFQYKKYLEMWDLETPDVVSVCLGTNEFKNVAVKDMPSEITKWNALMETLITDIHTNVDSNIKIVICNQGHFSNYGKDGIPTAIWNYKMWLHLKDLVKVFDNRTAQNIYVLAQGSEISAEYGFQTVMTEKNKWPLNRIDYETTATETSFANRSLVFPTELYHEINNNNDYPMTVDGKVERASVPEEKMKVVNTDVVHSTLSYPNQGVPIASFCQYIRQH